MSVNNNAGVLSQYREFLLPTYSNFPRGRYVSLLIIRKTESETIFRTEGSGEGLVKETVMAGIVNQKSLRRVVISKRKQTAVERRAGREVLREHNLLKKKDEKSDICAMNTNSPCGKCIDCYLYGYAVGGGGAQKSRVMTDDAYSLGPVAQVTGRRTFNATYEDGTMRNPVNREQASTSINEDEYVLPETHFLDIETLKDVTPGELQYVIANVLRSTRYGAISSRLGKVKNTLAAIIFSDAELFSNLELTQQVYDLLPGETDDKGNKELDFPLSDKAVLEQTQKAADDLLEGVVSRSPLVVKGEALEKVVKDTISLYRETDNVKAFLEQIEKGYANAGSK